MKKIDAHAHVGYFGGWADVGYTDEQMVAEMDRYDIETSVVSYMDNAVVEKAVRRFPGRFVGLTWANPYDGDKAVEAVVRDVREYGFKGIKLHPLLNAFTANDAVVHPLMETAAQMDLPVFIPRRSRFRTASFSLRTIFPTCGSSWCTWGTETGFTFRPPSTCPRSATTYFSKRRACRCTPKSVKPTIR